MTYRLQSKAFVKHYFSIKIGGVKFNARDLNDTLHAVQSENVVLSFSRNKIDILKNEGIIKDPGNSRWYTGATLGKKGKEFIEYLDAAIYRTDEKREKENWAAVKTIKKGFK